MISNYLVLSKTKHTFYHILKQTFLFLRKMYTRLKDASIDDFDMVIMSSHGAKQVMYNKVIIIEENYVKGCNIILSGSG